MRVILQCTWAQRKGRFDHEIISNPVKLHVPKLNRACHALRPKCGDRGNAVAADDHGREKENDPIH
jgi:hypothetical protein